MNLLDDGDNEGGEIVEGLKVSLEGLKYKKTEAYLVRGRNGEKASYYCGC